MSSFAKIDENNIVVDVIVANQDFIDSGAVGPAEQWVECAKDHSIRGRYPGIGHSYDPETDEFYPPKPPEFPSWVWNGLSGIEGKWVPPVPFTGTHVNQEMYEWNEDTQSWRQLTLEQVTFKTTAQLVQSLNTGTTFILPPNVIPNV